MADEFHDKLVVKQALRKWKAARQRIRVCFTLVLFVIVPDHDRWFCRPLRTALPSTSHDRTRYLSGLSCVYGRRMRGASCLRVSAIFV